MKPILILLAGILLCTTLQAQFVYTGKIEYERKINLYAQLKEMEESGPNPFIEQMKSKIPKFNSSYFDLSFNSNKSFYKPGREAESSPTMKMFGGGPATENIVLSDFGAHTVKAAKKVFEQKFYVEDSLRVLEWQLKDEIRTIANYKCHKAVAKICDSVYVVAFYAEEIPVSGGPEMFNGLPGMILELAIPRLHTTWTALKIDMKVPEEADFTVPDKGKKVNEKQLEETVYNSFKAWGKIAPRNIWWSVL
jgi:GLPGLI family protein